ncbi:hypothetical protein YC2023_020271 [Brassica napus]
MNETPASQMAPQSTGTPVFTPNHTHQVTNETPASPITQQNTETTVFTLNQTQQVHAEPSYETPSKLNQAEENLDDEAETGIQVLPPNVTQQRLVDIKQQTFTHKTHSQSNPLILTRKELSRRVFPMRLGEHLQPYFSPPKKFHTSETPTEKFPWNSILRKHKTSTIFEILLKRLKTNLKKINQVEIVDSGAEGDRTVELRETIITAFRRS